MSDAHRVLQLQKARDEEKSLFESRKDAVSKSSTAGLKNLRQSFASSFDTQFKSSTVGLVSAEEFKQKRQEDERKRKRELRRLEKMAKKANGSRAKKARLHTLSFAEEEEVELVEPKELKAIDASATKNPDVDTSFLPDRERDEAEANERERLAQEWKNEQERAKDELIEITYSYWDGSGHRRQTRVKKGARIDQFLETCRRELSETFKELRGVSVDNLMYIKEDLIVPHHHTFYELQLRKARGKSGPLFHFDVHHDIRLQSDARIEKDESHAGKVLLRSWYDRNKHIFPASRWEVFDPAKAYGKYTVA